jgi:hypothetical protein
MPENTNLILLASYAGSLFSFGRNAKSGTGASTAVGRAAMTAEREFRRLFNTGQKTPAQLGEAAGSSQYRPLTVSI